VVGKITPRARGPYSSVFNKAQLMQWARDGMKIRVSGWTMLDPEHPDDAVPSANGRPASRSTIWEIHPVMKVAPARAGSW
jgi:hypothetical protein